MPFLSSKSLLRTFAELSCAQSTCCRAAHVPFTAPSLQEVRCVDELNRDVVECAKNQRVERVS